MAKTAPFETHHCRYDDWFVRHAAAYQSELLAVRALLPWRGLGLEIGVGTGRFAAPLGVQVGIDPAREVLEYANNRGISCVQAVAEALPFAECCFDFVLNITTICFVDDATAMMLETHRVLKPGGALVVGFIDRESDLGQYYLANQAENVFYRDATFYSVAEVERLLHDSDFSEPVWVQTLSKRSNGNEDIAPIRSGSGQGAFVVVKSYRG